MMKPLLALFLATAAMAANTNQPSYYPVTPEIPYHGTNASFAASAFQVVARYVAAGGLEPGNDIEIARFAQAEALNIAPLVVYSNSVTVIDNDDYPRWWSGKQAAWNYDAAGDFGKAQDDINALLHLAADPGIISGLHQDFENIGAAARIGAMPAATLLQTNAVLSPLPTPPPPPPPGPPPPPPPDNHIPGEL